MRSGPASAHAGGCMYYHEAANGMTIATKACTNIVAGELSPDD